MSNDHQTQSNYGVIEGSTSCVRMDSGSRFSVVPVALKLVAAHLLPWCAPLPWRS
jgi:hypothetical protein